MLLTFRVPAPAALSRRAATSSPAVMQQPAYPAARSAASRVHAHFTHQFGAAAGSPALPDVATIEELIGAAFWASLRREEGFVPRISLAYVASDRAVHPMRFERPLPLAAVALARLAPAVERPGIHLAVSGDRNSLQVWGTTWAVPPEAVVIEVVAPGLLVVKHRHAEESAKFVNVAVLEGDQVKVLDARVPAQPDCPKLVTTLFGFDSPAAWIDSADVLVQFAVSMRAHGRGGLLLVVPAASASWKESIVQPIAYAVDPSFDELTRILQEAGASPAAQHERLSRAVDALAGLTAVDGATILTDRHELVAFGAKITRRRGHQTIERLIVTEPVEGVAPEIVHPGLLGGTRHLSAAQFVQDQQDAVALVASQDGGFTAFSWSPVKGMVQAYRLESLLM